MRKRMPPISRVASQWWANMRHALAIAVLNFCLRSATNADANCRRNAMIMPTGTRMMKLIRSRRFTQISCPRTRYRDSNGAPSMMSTPVVQTYLRILSQRIGQNTRVPSAKLASGVVVFPWRNVFVAVMSDPCDTTEIQMKKIKMAIIRMSVRTFARVIVWKKMRMFEMMYAMVL